MKSRLSLINPKSFRTWKYQKLSELPTRNGPKRGGLFQGLYVEGWNSSDTSATQPLQGEPWKHILQRTLQTWEHQAQSTDIWLKTEIKVRFLFLILFSICSWPQLIEEVGRWFFSETHWTIKKIPGNFWRIFQPKGWFATNRKWISLGLSP